MANHYTQTVVHQIIPNDCMAPIERWLLTQIFDHEPDGDGLHFFAMAFPQSEPDPEEQLLEAIETSRGTCPELCAAVEQAIRRHEDGKVRVDLDEIRYPAIFRSIVKRHPNRLPYISIEVSHSCTHVRKDGFGGSATFITSDTVEWVDTRQWLDERLTARGLKAIEFGETDFGLVEHETFF
jgi:hypothetical protein